MLLLIESTGRYTHHEAGESGMLLHKKGKLTIPKLKSSRLSYNVVVNLTFESILKLSTYKANMSDSVMSLISSS
jgi:hypothetical protein